MIGGGQGEYITLGLANFTWDSISGIFAFDANVQNNLRQSMSTPDGTTVTGVQIFFYSGPTCTGGTCSVSNADGYSNFNADSQPYFEYNQLLQPQQTSSSRNWQIYLSPTVNDFDFAIEAYAAFPAETSTPATAPQTVPDSIASVSHIVTNDATFVDAYLNDIVVVAFVPGTTQSDRALAIAKLGGTIVGGWGLSSLDGDYAAWVPNATGTLASLDGQTPDG